MLSGPGLPIIIIVSNYSNWARPILTVKRFTLCNYNNVKIFIFKTRNVTEARMSITPNNYTCTCLYLMSSVMILLVQGVVRCTPPSEWTKRCLQSACNIIIYIIHVLKKKPGHTTCTTTNTTQPVHADNYIAENNFAYITLHTYIPRYYHNYLIR